MTVDQWGRSGWVFIHACTYAYPESPSIDQKRRMLMFLRSIGHVLPCEKCCFHYRRSMTPLLSRDVDSKILQSRADLTRAMFDLHNDVNVRNGKPLAQYDEVCNMYAPIEGYGKCNLMRHPGKSARPPLLVAFAYFTGSMVIALTLVIAIGKAFHCKRIKRGNAS